MTVSFDQIYNIDPSNTFEYSPEYEPIVELSEWFLGDLNPSKQSEICFDIPWISNPPSDFDPKDTDRWVVFPTGEVWEIVQPKPASQPDTYDKNAWWSGFSNQFRICIKRK